MSYYTSSCPTTPLSSRKHCQSPYRTTQTLNTSPPSPASPKKGVFQTLYRPDLIKLSDPRRRQRRYSEDEYVSDTSASVRSAVSVRSVQSLNTTNPHFTSTPFSSPYMRDFDRVDQQEFSKVNRKISDDCDQLLRDLETDMKNFNFKKRDNYERDINQTEYKQNVHNKTVKPLSSHNKQMLYLDKPKMIEIKNCLSLNEAPSKSICKIEEPQNLMGKSNNQEYFDSLIAIIENAARNLSDV